MLEWTFASFYLHTIPKVEDFVSSFGIIIDNLKGQKDDRKPGRSSHDGYRISKGLRQLDAELKGAFPSTASDTVTAPLSSAVPEALTPPSAAV